MLSISIRYGGKLNYAMRALGPMLRSNSSQTETALSQMLGHDGASRHTLLSKMLRHNSARTQDHSNTSIGLRQRTCAAVRDMFLWKNHGCHFTTIKSIGKTYYPVPLRFAVSGSASARSAPPPPTLATPWHRGDGARQSPTSRGGRAARQRHAARDNRAARQRYTARNGRAARQTPQHRGQQRHPRPRLLMLRPLRRHSHQRRHPCPKLRSTASPRAHGTEEGKLAWTEQDNNHLSFACAAEGS